MVDSKQIQDPERGLKTLAIRRRWPNMGLGFYREFSRWTGISNLEPPAWEVLDGSKLPKTEKVGETPMAPRKRGGEEIHLFEAKRRRQERFKRNKGRRPGRLRHVDFASCRNEGSRKSRSQRDAFQYFMLVRSSTMYATWNPKRPVQNGCLVKQPFPMSSFGMFWNHPIETAICKWMCQVSGNIWVAVSICFTPIWGRFPFWRAYFSNGLVQPPTRYIYRYDLLRHVATGLPSFVEASGFRRDLFQGVCHAGRVTVDAILAKNCSWCKFCEHGGLSTICYFQQLLSWISTGSTRFQCQLCHSEPWTVC